MCGREVRYSIVAGQGTLVEATAAVDTERFAAAVQTALAEAQNASR